MFGLGCVSAVPLFFVEVTADSEQSKNPSHQLDLLKILESYSLPNLHHDWDHHGNTDQNLEVVGNGIGAWGKYDAMSGIVPLPGTKTPLLTTAYCLNTVHSLLPAV